jgi:hypothetical protein
LQPPFRFIYANAKLGQSPARPDLLTNPRFSYILSSRYIFVVETKSSLQEVKSRQKAR